MSLKERQIDKLCSYTQRKEVHIKSEKDTKYKIMLRDGTIYLTRGRMGAVLIEKMLQIWIHNKNYEDLGMNLLYGLKGYQNYTDDELIDEIYEYFVDPNEIRELLATQEKRLKIFNAQNKREGMELLKEINKKKLQKI